MAKIVNVTGKKGETQPRKPKRQAIGTPRYSAAKSVTAAAAGKDNKSATIALAREIESDPQFNLGRLVLESLVQAMPVTIERPANDPRAKALADNLTQRFNEIEKHALRCIAHGAAAFNRWYQYDPQDRVSLVQLAYLEYEYAHLKLNAGDYDGILLKVDEENQIDLFAEETWWLAIDPTAQCPHGVSRYRGAPQKVLAKAKQHEANEANYAKRFANGQTFGYAPSAYPDDTGKGDARAESNGDPKDPIADMSLALSNVESGGNAVFSSAVDPQTNQPLFRVDTTTVQPTATFLENQRDKLADDKFASLGIPPRAVSQNGDVGALATATAHTKTLFRVVGGLKQQIVASFQKYVIEDAEAVNYPAGSRPGLKMIYQDLSDDRTDMILAIIQAILQQPALSPLLTYGVVDLAKLLEVAKIPVGPMVAEKLAQILADAKAQPQAPLQFSLNDRPPSEMNPWPANVQKLVSRIQSRKQQIETLLADPERAKAATQPGSPERREL